MSTTSSSSSSTSDATEKKEPEEKEKKNRKEAKAVDIKKALEYHLRISPARIPLADNEWRHVLVFLLKLLEFEEEKKDEGRLSVIRWYPDSLEDIFGGWIGIGSTYTVPNCLMMRDLASKIIPFSLFPKNSFEFQFFMYFPFVRLRSYQRSFMLMKTQEEDFQLPKEKTKEEEEEEPPSSSWQDPSAVYPGHIVLFVLTRVVRHLSHLDQRLDQDFDPKDLENPKFEEEDRDQRGNLSFSSSSSSSSPTEPTTEKTDKKNKNKKKKKKNETKKEQKTKGKGQEEEEVLEFQEEDPNSARSIWSSETHGVLVRMSVLLDYLNEPWPFELLKEMEVVSSFLSPFAEWAPQAIEASFSSSSSSSTLRKTKESKAARFLGSFFPFTFLAPVRMLLEEEDAKKEKQKQKEQEEKKEIPKPEDTFLTWRQRQPSHVFAQPRQIFLDISIFQEKFQGQDEDAEFQANKEEQPADKEEDSLSLIERVMMQTMVTVFGQYTHVVNLTEKLMEEVGERRPWCNLPLPTLPRATMFKGQDVKYFVKDLWVPWILLIRTVPQERMSFVTRKLLLLMLFLGDVENDPVFFVLQYHDLYLKWKHSQRNVTVILNLQTNTNNKKKKTENLSKKNQKMKISRKQETMDEEEEERNKKKKKKNLEQKNLEHSRKKQAQKQESNADEEATITIVPDLDMYAPDDSGFGLDLYQICLEERHKYIVRALNQKKEGSTENISKENISKENVSKEWFRGRSELLETLMPLMSPRVPLLRIMTSVPIENWIQFGDPFAICQATAEFFGWLVRWFLTIKREWSNGMSECYVGFAKQLFARTLELLVIQKMHWPAFKSPAYASSHASASTSSSSSDASPSRSPSGSSTASSLD